MGLDPSALVRDTLGRKAETMFTMKTTDIIGKTTGTVVTDTAVVGITERNKGNEEDRGTSTCRMC